MNKTEGSLTKKSVVLKRINKHLTLQKVHKEKIKLRESQTQTVKSGVFVMRYDMRHGRQIKFRRGFVMWIYGKEY